MLVALILLGVMSVNAMWAIVVMGRAVTTLMNVLSRWMIVMRMLTVRIWMGGYNC